ncbi:hypothetical protein [Niveibacterium terrae]|uniref:hypothetical protein n=1 Tax=Niveibacterium terrae TaxID=3373598 RepID=UPI003A93FB41
MKIASSEMSLSATHSLSQSRQERISFRTGAAALDNNASAQRPRVELSSAGQALLDEARKQQVSTASAQTANVESGSKQVLPVQLQILKNIIEQLTGREIRLFDMSGVASGEATAPAESAQSAAANAASQEPTFAFDYQSVSETTEQTDFSASGKITLGDGSTVDFSLSLSLTRVQREETSLSIRSGAAAQTKDPLILSFGAGVKATGARTEFALTDGMNSLPVLAGAAYLVRDANGNGRADGGSELFGPASGDGFEELAKLDQDGNGWIDEGDAAFTQLKLWQPDAQGEGGLVTLKQAGVGALYLGRVASPFTLADGSGQEQAKLKSSGVYLNEDGSAGALQQIDVVA